MGVDRQMECWEWLFKNRSESGWRESGCVKLLTSPCRHGGRARKDRLILRCRLNAILQTDITLSGRHGAAAKNTYIQYYFCCKCGNDEREDRERDSVPIDGPQLMPYLIFATVSLFVSLIIYLLILILSIMWYFFMLGTNNGIIGAVFIGLI